MRFERLSNVYTADTARRYEAERLARPEWALEQIIVQRWLSALPAGTTLMDIPVGTGRFFEFHKRFGLIPTGIDISLDMLAQARERSAALGLDAALSCGDIRHIAAADKSFDGTVCVRFLNWIDFMAAQEVLTELGRITRSMLIVSVLVWSQPTSPWQWFSQRFMSLRLRRGGVHVHQEQAVTELFGRIGFKALASEPVRSAQPGGAKYLFYLLQRTS